MSHPSVAVSHDKLSRAPGSHPSSRPVPPSQATQARASPNYAALLYYSLLVMTNSLPETATRTAVAGLSRGEFPRDKMSRDRRTPHITFQYLEPSPSNHRYSSRRIFIDQKFEPVVLNPAKAGTRRNTSHMSYIKREFAPQFRSGTITHELLGENT